MPGPTSVPLNAEPAQQGERKEHHLPPKRYADAVEEKAPANGEILNGGTANAGGRSKKVNGGSNDAGKDGTKRASVLRIVDTGVPEQEEKSERPQVERHESKHEYSATGIDDTARTPTRQKKRKSPSSSLNGTELRAKTPEKGSTPNSEFKSPKSEARDENTTFFEKEGTKNGRKLVSVKPAVKFEDQNRTDDKPAPKKSKDQELKTGRKAGQRWETSAIRFAPMNVPLQRRLQTGVVLFHTICIAIFVSLFFFLCAIPLFWPLLIPYLIYCMVSKGSTDGKLRHRSEFVRKSPIWSLFASYYPARLHRTQELPPTRKYIFGYHPHGIISHGAFAAFATEALGFSQLFPGIKNTLLTLDSNFRIPIYRDYILSLGLASVSKESCENLLCRGGTNGEGMGRAITIVVGGARESLDALPYALRLVLKRRKGFVKMALRTGADLVPVLAFGENDLYDQFHAELHPTIHKFQLLVKKVLGFTIPLFHARGVFNYDVGLMPYRRPLNIVVGKPIKVLQNTKPGQEEIDRLHEEYVTELVRLWDTWKDDFAPNRQEELQIIE